MSKTFAHDLSSSKLCKSRFDVTFAANLLDAHCIINLIKGLESAGLT